MAQRLIDLSQEIYQGMPVYAGHLKTVIWEHASHEEIAPSFEGGFSYATRGLLLSDHGPTHVDALAHLDPAPSAPTIELMGLEHFYGPGTCIDVSDARAHTDITPERLQQATRDAGDQLR